MDFKEKIARIMANSDDSSFHKLPEFAKPTLYEITLSSCLNTFKFTGTEKIFLDILQSTDYLQLHASCLEILDASLKLADGKAFSQLQCELDEKRELMVVRLLEPVQPQKVELSFTFRGEIRNDMQGFYRSPYKDSNGTDQFMASTFFESTFARRCFPCWDEPIYKAQFDIQLEVAQGLNALSNMDIVSERELPAGRKLVTFARTPLMSTYLVAFAIGQFEFIEANTKDNCRVRVYTVPGKKEHGRYALEVAVKAIEFFSDWFNIKMPLPKCDLIGIPEFQMGAQENWGLISFREVYLLYDPAQSSSKLKQLITVYTAHEVAHFWFGNLVTMKWWCDLWLKEGFAMFMEYVFTSALFPEFKIWLQFVNDQVKAAMELDSLRGSHPIEVPIENPNELEEIYDEITYEKSNSVIRMLYNYLGEEVFQKALRAYLVKYSYANADTSEFWQCLSEASGIDVAALMGSWTKQIGFPLVTVEDRQLDGNRRELHLRQRRFLVGGPDEDNHQWLVPVPVTVASDPSKAKVKFLLDQAEAKFTVEGVEPNEWIKVNSGFTSFFRVQYSDGMFKQLLEGMRKRGLDLLDRFQIADDLFAIIKSGQMPITAFLEFFNACAAQEDELVIWQSMYNSFAHINSVLDHCEEGKQLKGQFYKFICNIVEPVSARYGWEPKEGESHLTVQLRALLINLLARCQHPPTIQTAMAKFKEYTEKNVELVPDLRTVIFNAVTRTGDKQAIGELKRILASCNFSEIERACLTAFGQCTDSTLLDELFDHCILKKSIKSQDIYMLFSSVSNSACANSQLQTWAFFVRNVQLFRQLYESPKTSLFQSCFKYAAECLCSTQSANDVMEFCRSNFNEDEMKTLDRPIRQVLETIKMNERLMKNSVGPIREFLQKIEI